MCVRMHARTRGRTGKTAGYVCSSGAEGEQRTTGKAVKGGPAYQIPHTARRGGGVAHPFARCDQRDRARFHCPREIRDGLTSFHQQSPISCLFLLQSSISCLFLLLSPMSCMFLLQFHISCLFLLQSPISCELSRGSVHAHSTVTIWGFAIRGLGLGRVNLKQVFGGGTRLEPELIAVGGVLGARVHGKAACGPHRPRRAKRISPRRRRERRSPPSFGKCLRTCARGELVAERGAVVTLVPWHTQRVGIPRARLRGRWSLRRGGGVGGSGVGRLAEDGHAERARGFRDRPD